MGASATMDRVRGMEQVRRSTLDQARLVAHLLRFIALGSASGVLAGIVSWAFLEALDWATATRLDQPWLLWLAPPVGLAVGLVYHRLGGRAARGNLLLLDEIHEPTAWVPRRMAPLVFGGTVVGHLVGGSAGREGAALQMSGSLTDLLSRLLRLSPTDRRLLLIAALAGGFGAVFGTPLAGTVFALEVQRRGWARYEALVPSLAAALVGHLMFGWLGHEHAVLPQLTPQVDAWLAARMAAAGLLFGLTAALLVELTHGLRILVGRLIRWEPLRPAVGGVAVIGLVGLFGRDYLGLSLPLIDDALNGAESSWAVPALKLLFTVVVLATSWPGGEVTPLFVIGTTMGAALAGPLGTEPTLLAAVGFVGVFAGASNAPLACTILAVELFGGGLLVPAAVACVTSFVFSGEGGLYVRHEAA
jgi:H+/Cl- antiporter ClcA